MDFQLTNAQTLTVNGALDDQQLDTGNITLTTNNGGALVLNANVTTQPGQTVKLASAGSIDQTGGIITTGTLTGSSVGGATLNDDNKITDLGPFDNTGSMDFQLTNAQTLTVNGALDDKPLDTGNITLTTNSGGNLILSANVTTLPTQTVKLVSAGSIDQTGGIITTGRLTGSAAGATTLNDDNQIAELDTFDNVGGAFSLTDTLPLVIAGTLDATGQTATLIDSGGGIDAHAGVIEAAMLTGSTAGVADFTDAGNAIGTLNGFTNTSGAFSLTDSIGLSITGALDATGRTLTLTDTGGGIDAHSGIVKAATLTGSTSGDADFSDAGNVIGALNGFTNTSGNFALTDSVPLTILGTIDVTGQTLALTDTGGGIDAHAGILKAATLTGSTSGIADFTNAANAIVAIDGFSNTSGPFSLTDSIGLAITGTLDATGQTLTLVDSGGGIDAHAGILNAAVLTGSTQGVADFSNDGNAVQTLNGFTNTLGAFSLSDSVPLTILGTLDATGQTLTLNDFGGGIDAHSAILKAAALTGSSAGVADFTNAGNVIETLNGFSNTSGAMSLTDSVALTITGTLDTTGQTLTLVDTGGGIDASAGIVKAATLTGSTAGDAVFTDPANLVSTLAGFTSLGNFSLIDDPDLVITGTLNASGHAVLLEATAGSIDAHTASIVADSLQGLAETGADFSGTNTINSLGNFTIEASGAFIFANSQALLIAGTVQDHVGPMTIETASGNLTIQGTLDASGQTLTLISAGGINEDVGQIIAGTIVTGTLTGSSGAGVDLTSKNSVGTLGDFSTGAGNFALTVDESLVVAGKIQSAGGSITLAATAGDLTVLGPVTAGQTITFNAAGNFLQNDGLLAANVVDIVAGANILIGEKSFTDLVGDPNLAPETINLAIDKPFFRPSAAFKNHLFVDAETLKLTAPQKIISENTGTQPDVIPYQPMGIALVENGKVLPVALLIGGRPTVVDLFGTLTQNGVKVDPKTIATSGQVQLTPTTPEKTRYRVDGCTIHQNLTCVAIHVDINNVEPAKLADLVLLAAPSPDDEENDPTITGSGNDEIWREQ
jgi:hypothetical protein